MNIAFWSKRKTFSLYEAGFLLSGIEPVALREDFSNSYERIVQEKYGFAIPFIIFKEKKGLTPIPTALKLNKSHYPMEHWGIIIDSSAMSGDRGTSGYYQWRYNPITVSMVQRAIFSDLIMAIQKKQLSCMERGFVPETNNFEITGYSVTLLLDTIISHEALCAWASGLPELPKFLCSSPGLVKAEAQNKTIQDVKMPPETFVKSLRKDVNGIWRAVMHTGKKDKAFQTAVEYLKNHPESKIIKDDLSLEAFQYVGQEKAKRSMTGQIIQAAQIRNGYPKLGQNKIESILSAM
ncbi:MAG: hypothetical protein HY881_16000 [Deltaproteobacteria bacterium]|nr:hypothetical protein [Deltaproteobacteria bacterium]